MKTIHSILSLSLVSILALGLAACGSGSGGSSAAPPSDLAAVAGDESITVNWTASSGVEYWVLIGPPGTTFDNASTTTCAVYEPRVTPPLVLSSITCANTVIPLNGSSFDVSVNARINGGPGGTAVSKRNLAVRNGATTWATLSTPSAARNLTSVAYGAPMNSSGVMTAVAPVFAFVDSASHVFTATFTPTTAGAIQTAVANTATLSGTVNSIAYDASYAFLAGSSTAGQSSYSLDGVTWTAQSGAPANITAVGSRGGSYLTAGSDCKVYSATGNISSSTSATATTWTSQTGPGLLTGCQLNTTKTLSVSGTAYDLVAGTQGGAPYIAYTTGLNGTSTTWATGYNTGSGSIASINAGSIASGVPLWVAVGNSGAAGLGVYSLNGTSWTVAPSWSSGACAAGVVCLPTTTPLTSVAFKSDPWGYITQAIVSDSAGNIYTGVFSSTAGSGPGTSFVLTWTKTHVTSSGAINALAVGPFGYFAVGAASVSPSSNPGVIYTSY